MSSLDVKDRKILYYLSQNGRMPYSELSKLIELSKNSTKYRVDQLVQKRIIKHFTAVTNLGSLNLNTYTILLKFNEDIYENQELINHIKNHEYAGWAVTLSGNWDIFAEFIAKNLNHFTNTVTKIIEHYGAALNDYKVMFSNQTLRVEHLIKDIYQDLELQEIPADKRTQLKYEIDEKDKIILHELNKDSAQSLIDLAKKTKLTLDIVRYRVNKLIKTGIIIKFFPEIDLKLLGYTEYLFKIKLTNVEDIANIKNQIKQNNNITYAFIDTNEFNIVFACAFKNSEQIDQLTRTLRKHFGNIINNQEHYIIKEQIKFNLYPEGLTK